MAQVRAHDSPATLRLRLRSLMLRKDKVSTGNNFRFLSAFCPVSRPPFYFNQIPNSRPRSHLPFD
jgi:hypothetical protein